jgi:hypothetical protein
MDSGTLNYLVSSLKRFAAEYGCSGPAETFIVYDDTLIGWHRVQADAGLQMRILNRHRQLIRITLPFTADKITVDRNARIFGFDRRKDRTAKILMKPPARPFFGDVRARRLIASLLAGDAPITVPRLLAYDRKHAGWLVEEFVEGTWVSRGDAPALLAALIAAGFYQSTARLRPVGRLGYGFLAKSLAELDPLFPKITDGALWPVGLTHHDLHDGNVLRTTDGRYCLIDWEQGGVGPVAIDLAYVYRLNPDLKAAVVRFLQQLDPKGLGLPAELQLALGVVQLSRPVWQDRQVYIEDARKGDSCTYEEAVGRFNRDFQGIKDYLAFLRSA